MKAIINKLRYDTEKAELIGAASSNFSRGDFKWWYAELYRTTRSRRYFLAGEGGPLTRWAKPAGNMRTGGEGIIPLDADEALEWAERHLDHSAIEREFSGVIEDA